MQNRLNITCETLENPIGVDCPHPRFSWVPQSKGFLSPQKSYSIRVLCGDKPVFESGEVESSSSIGVPYEGEELKSFTVYQVEITCKLTDGSVYFGKSGFETGIFSNDLWKGSFLSYPKYEKRQSPVFLYRFKAKAHVRSCRAYFSGLGYGELYINGKKTDNSLLDPAWTDYRERVLYRTWDVTDDVKEGVNTARILLADGWMAHNHRYFRPKPPLPWYREPCFLLNIRVTYENGETETFAPTEEDCICNTSEILSQNLFDGEEYSAPRREELRQMEKMDESSMKANGWVNAVSVQLDSRRKCQLMPPIREIESFEPVRVASISPSVYVADMGINFSGYVRITVTGEAGSSVKMKYSELANDDDTVNQVNLRFAQCTDIYHLKGEKIEVYSPRFTYRGYRFVELTLTGAVKVLKVEGVRVNTGVERIGTFSCDSDLINRIYRMLINTEMNNMHSVPTDCPQRDERLGWMNDNTMRLEQNFMNFDSQLFYEKWFDDILDQQNRIGSGAIPDTCPYYYGMNPARWNTSVFVMIPYLIYRYFGDIQPIKRHWNRLLWYMEYQKTKLTSEGVIDEYYVGEWCPPMKDSILEDHQSAFAKEISNQLLTSCFYYLECLLCAKMADIVGDVSAKSDFESRMKGLKEAINRKFFDESAGSYLPKCQGNLILPLFLGLVPQNYRKDAENALIWCIKEKDCYHISTGSHSTRFLFEVLTMIGQDDTAVRMLEETTYPSFGYMLANGATALWERWEKNLGFMTSHDHPMTGGFGVWFFKCLGGIDVGIMDGREELLIAPAVPKKLNYVNSHRKFRTGEVMSNWYRVGGEVHFDIRIPWNTKATLCIPRLGRDQGSVTFNGCSPSEDQGFSETCDKFFWKAETGYFHIVLKEPS